MAFFRKPKKAKDTGRIGRAAGEGLSSQAKWDELERLVNSDAEPSETSGATADTPKTTQMKAWEVQDEV